MQNVFFNLILIVQILSALGIIVLVLMQHGKGADMGAAFGSGASGSVFGASGSANFLSRSTAVLATVFFVCTLGLAFLIHKPKASNAGGVMQGVPAQSAPAVPGGAAPAQPAAPASAPAAPAAPSVPGGAPTK
ncbi:preprotein translocase subunit SecG [Piscinibacterium candidicorallinum]|jgi:preprotein translocase subunit SecG|uniref:Protein-export membrane protein SecG n=1 Tax=Piscinibacterium candidicorallinum TaxID=1793872 RepID=A0ABV7H1S8_9BURK